MNTYVGTGGRGRSKPKAKMREKECEHIDESAFVLSARDVVFPVSGCRCEENTKLNSGSNSGEDPIIFQQKSLVKPTLSRVNVSCTEILEFKLSRYGTKQA